MRLTSCIALIFLAASASAESCITGELCDRVTQEGLSCGSADTCDTHAKEVYQQLREGAAILTDGTHKGDGEVTSQDQAVANRKIRLAEDLKNLIPSAELLGREVRATGQPNR